MLFLWTSVSPQEKLNVICIFFLSSSSSFPSSTFSQFPLSGCHATGRDSFPVKSPKIRKRVFLLKMLISQAARVWMLPLASQFHFPVWSQSWESATHHAFLVMCTLISKGDVCVCVCVCVWGCGCFDLCRCAFWLRLSAWKSFQGSQGDIDSAAAAPEALSACQIDKSGRGRARRRRLWRLVVWRWWRWVLMFSRPPPPGSSLPRPSQRAASGFPSVFPKLHWFWPLYLRGPGPLALTVTLRGQKTLSHDSAVHANTKREAFVAGACCF